MPAVVSQATRAMFMRALLNHSEHGLADIRRDANVRRPCGFEQPMPLPSGNSGKNGVNEIESSWMIVRASGPNHIYVHAAELIEGRLPRGTRGSKGRHHPGRCGCCAAHNNIAHDMARSSWCPPGHL